MPVLTLQRASLSSRGDPLKGRGAVFSVPLKFSPDLAANSGAPMKNDPAGLAGAFGSLDLTRTSAKTAFMSPASRKFAMRIDSTPSPALTASRLDRRDGFTLIETLLALTVILFGFMAVLVMHTGAMRSGTLAEVQTLAVFLAESKIEEFRVQTPDGFPDNVPVVDWLDRQGRASAKADAFFTRSITLKYQVPTQFTDELTVSVSWAKSKPLVYTSVIPR